MDDRPSGEVQRPKISDPAPDRPDPMGQRIVDKRRPEQGEDQKTAELHPLGEGAGHEGRRDHRKHHLKDHEGLMGHGRGIIDIGL